MSDREPATHKKWVVVVVFALGLVLGIGALALFLAMHQTPLATLAAGGGTFVGSISTFLQGARAAGLTN
jgi:hypothetical protein